MTQEHTSNNRSHAKDKCINCKMLFNNPLRFSIFAGERKSVFIFECIKPKLKNFESANDEIKTKSLLE